MRSGLRTGDIAAGLKTLGKSRKRGTATVFLDTTEVSFRTGKKEDGYVDWAPPRVPSIAKLEEVRGALEEDSEREADRRRIDRGFKGTRDAAFG